MAGTVRNRRRQHKEEICADYGWNAAVECCEGV